MQATHPSPVGIRSWYDIWFRELEDTLFKNKLRIRATHSQGRASNTWFVIIQASRQESGAELIVDRGAYPTTVRPPRATLKGVP